jgi:hypothetical protein
MAITFDNIQTSVNIPTKAGTRKWYTEPFAGNFGYSNWPARTNKVTCRKYNPVDTSNLTLSGDAAAVLSVVDDTAALTAAGLIGICTSGKVYKLDNSAGSTDAVVACGGSTGNTNDHYYSAYCSGVGDISRGGSVVVKTTFDNAGYVRVLLLGAGVSSESTLRVRVPAGSIVYFILPDLQEGAFITPPIFDPDEDTLATVTRPATELDEPLEEVGTQLQLVVIPAATDTAGTLLDDGTNKLSYDGTNLIFTDGVTTLSAATTLTAGTAYTIGVKGLAGDWALSVNGTDIDTDTGSLVAWGTVNLGRNAADGDHFGGYFPNVAGYVGSDAGWYKTSLG